MLVRQGMAGGDNTDCYPNDGPRHRIYVRRAGPVRGGVARFRPTSGLMQRNKRLPLLNDLVCAGEGCGRYGETQRFRGLEVNEEPVFVRFHYWQVARLFARENSGGIDTGLPPDVGRVGAVADQAASPTNSGHSYMTGTDSRAAREMSRSRFTERLGPPP